MRATFDTEKRAKPSGRTAHDTSAGRAAHAEKSVEARSGLPFFLRERLGGGASSAPPPLQAKLVVGAPGDDYEREADLAAQLAASAPTLPDASRHVRAADGPSPDEHLAQPKLQANGGASAKALGTVVGATGSGSSLPTTVRHKVEPLLGVDLGDVRVHTDAAAHSSARRLEAKAFTHQNHIWLGPHQSADDVELMAHELTHVVQQTGSDAPPQTLQRQAEESADGDAVRLRLQQRIDEALGERSPARRPPAAESAASAPSAAEPASPAPATEDPEARQAAREVDRAAVRERAHELHDEARPDVDRAAEQRPQVEEAAQATVEALESPPGQRGEAAGAQQGEGAAAQRQQGEGAGAAVGGQKAAGAAGAAGQQAAAALQQAAGAADEAFSVADSMPTPDTPEIIVPPPEIAPVDAGGQPLAGDPATDARAIELANDAQHIREQGQSLREQAVEGATNAQILRGNVGLVGEGITGSEGGVQTAESHLTFRRGLVEQARSALGVSERKAAEVAAGAPRGVEQTNENKARSGPMASEARDLTSRNSENTPDDPEDAANTREQGENFNRAGSDAATIDDTLTQVQGAANTLVEDSARATQLNSQVNAGTVAVGVTLDRAEARIGQMQGQNAEARAQLDAVREQPAEVSAQAGEIGAEGQDLVQSSRDIETRLHAVQQNYAAGMASVPAQREPSESEADAPAAEPTAQEPEPPEAAAPTEESALVETGSPSGASANAGAPPPPSESEFASSESEEVLVQRQPEDGAAAEPSNINIASGLPSWLTGVPDQDEAARARAQREHEERRQGDLDMIEAELHGRRFEQLSANERRMLALRVSTRNLFSGLRNISWPSPGGIARGAGRLAIGLIDPRGPMMGVVSGFNMIINSTVNFARQPSWSGALRLAANIATGLAIIFGSITALAAVIAAAMTALTILTLGIAAPFAGPIIAFCATVMSVVGGWTFYVGLLAAGLQALTFLADLYMAGTAQTAEQLQQHSEHLREDASNATNSLLQAGMGRLAQVGGRHMQRAITRAGGGVRFAAQTGARALPARVVRGVGRLPGRIRSAGGVRPYLSGLRAGARTGWGNFRTRVATAGGFRSYLRQGVAGFGSRARDTGRTLWRELRSGGPRDVSVRQGFSRNYLLGEGIPGGPGLAGTWRTLVGMQRASTTVRRVVAIQEELTLLGRADLNQVIDDVARLHRQGRIEGFDDWVSMAHTRSADDMARMTAELHEARRLQAEIAGDATRVVVIGQDDATRGKSFDISVERRVPGAPPVITRRVETFAEEAVVSTANELNQGIAHGASKAFPTTHPPTVGAPVPGPGQPLPVGTPPGTREATVRVNWPPPPGPVGGDSQMVFGTGGAFEVRALDGTVRRSGNILDNVVRNLRTNIMRNPKVDYLHAVNIIDQQGNLVGRVVNNGAPDLGIGNWSR